MDSVPSGSGKETWVVGSARVKVSVCIAGPVSFTVMVSTALVKVQVARLIPSNPVGMVPLNSNLMGS